MQFSRFLSFIALFLCPIITYSQWEEGRVTSRHIERGTPYEVIDAPEKHYFTLDDVGVAVKIEDQTIHTQVFDLENLRLKSRSETELEEKRMIIEGILSVGGNVYLAYAWWDKDAEKERLFLRKLDLKSAELEKPEKVFQSDKKLAGTKAKKGWFRVVTIDKFDFYSSGDGSYLIAQYRLKPEEYDDSKNKDVVGFVLFDEEMEKKWHSRIEMPYTEARMNNIDYAVDKESNIHLLTEVAPPGKNVDDGDVHTHYELMKLEEGEDEMEIEKVDLGDLFVYDVSMEVDPGGGLVVSGTYTNHEGSNDVKGLFMFPVDKDNDVDDIHKVEFPIAYMKDYHKSRRQRKYKEKGKDHEDVGMAGLEVSDIYFYENGDYLLIGEEYRNETHTTYNANNGATHVHYSFHYNDMVAARISSDGDVEWMKHLPKSQFGDDQNVDDLSYRMVKGDKGVYLLFLDNEDNMDADPGEELDEHESQRGGYLTSYYVGHDEGKVKKYSFFDIHEVKGLTLEQFGMNRFFFPGDGEFIFEAYKNRKEDILMGVDL